MVFAGARRPFSAANKRKAPRRASWWKKRRFLGSMSWWVLRSLVGNTMQDEFCDFCRGSGKIMPSGKQCPVCGGTGRKPLTVPGDDEPPRPTPPPLPKR